MQSIIQTTKPQKGYELLDSGKGEKLERFGDFVLRRPDPQALWDYVLPEDVWKKADAFLSEAQKTPVGLIPINKFQNNGTLSLVDLLSKFLQPHLSIQDYFLNSCLIGSGWNRRSKIKN